MKKKFLFLAIFFLFFTVNITSVNAADTVQNIKIKKTTNSKVYLTWNKVKNADKYIIRIVAPKNKKLFFKKKSKDNSAVISGLDAFKNYRVQIKAKVNGKFTINKAKNFKTKKGSLYLTGKSYNETVAWQDAEGTDNVYALVWSKKANPTFPTRCTDNASITYYSHFVNGDINAFDGAGTYYVRVCRREGDGCGKYSNQIKVKLKKAPEQEVNLLDEVDNISLFTPDFFGCTKTYNVSWYWSKGYAEDGFQLVYSKNPKPQYPLRAGDYNTHYKKPGQWMGKVKAKDGSGTYYARVCSFYYGRCWAYSNQITLEL